MCILEVYTTFIANSGIKGTSLSVNRRIPTGATKAEYRFAINTVKMCCPLNQAGLIPSE